MAKSTAPNPTASPIASARLDEPAPDPVPPRLDESEPAPVPDPVPELVPTIGRIVIVRLPHDECRDPRDVPAMVTAVRLLPWPPRGASVDWDKAQADPREQPATIALVDVVAFDSARGTVYLDDLPHVSQAPHGWAWPKREG